MKVSSINSTSTWPVDHGKEQYRTSKAATPTAPAAAFPPTVSVHCTLYILHFCHWLMYKVYDKVYDKVLTSYFVLLTNTKLLVDVVICNANKAKKETLNKCLATATCIVAWL